VFWSVAGQEHSTLVSSSYLVIRFPTWWDAGFELLHLPGFCFLKRGVALPRMTPCGSMVAWPVWAGWASADINAYFLLRADVPSLNSGQHPGRATAVPLRQRTAARQQQHRPFPIARTYAVRADACGRYHQKDVFFPPSCAVELPVERRLCICLCATPLTGGVATMAAMWRGGLPGSFPGFRFLVSLVYSARLPFCCYIPSSFVH